MLQVLRAEGGCPTADSLLEVKHFRRGGFGFSRHRVYPSDDFRGQAGLCRPSPLVHRQDEPTGLSLGMVASQQSLLPFHPAIDSTSNWIFGNSSLPSYGLPLLKIP
jgi:hypothetical protein